MYICVYWGYDRVLIVRRPLLRFCKEVSLVGQRVLLHHGTGWEFEVKSGELLAERFGLEKGNWLEKHFLRL